jgi:hypothetical protein
MADPEQVLHFAKDIRVVFTDNVQSALIQVITDAGALSLAMPRTVVERLARQLEHELARAPAA